MDIDIYKYLREKQLPHIWCPGCGHGTILGNLIRGIDRAGYDQDKTVVVSGIGCSGRASGYLNFDTLHVTHGRAIPFATGIKLANPELNVIVITGDGDGAAIGGNHLIHGCRRNLEMTVILFNNQIYGMTGGQFSPMTPMGDKGTTVPYGNIDQNFNLVEMTKSAGATFIARTTTYHVNQLLRILTRGLKHKGFTFIETISQCPINYGKRNGMKSVEEMLKWQKESAVDIKKWERLSPEDREGKFPTGVLYHENRSEYSRLYDKVIEKAQKEREANV